MLTEMSMFLPQLVVLKIFNLFQAQLLPMLQKMMTEVCLQTELLLFLLVKIHLLHLQSFRLAMLQLVYLLQIKTGKYLLVNAVLMTLLKLKDIMANKINGVLSTN